MKRFSLTSKDKAYLEKRHKLCNHGKERDRIKAVLLYSEGRTIPMISQALRIHETSVNRHLNDYSNGKLKPENGGSESDLNEFQSVEPIAHLEERTYHYVHEIIEYFSLKYGVSYSVPGMNKWLHLNLVGAIELENLGNTEVFEYKTINAEVIVDFLDHLRQKHASARKIHLILDQSGYHRAVEVKNEAKRLGIKLHYLPPYSPNLNPIERLWKVMNEYTRNNRFFKSAKDFKDSLCNFFRYTLPEISGSLTTRINDNFQIF